MRIKLHWILETYNVDQNWLASRFNYKVLHWK